MTNGIVSVMKDGKTILKMVAGCDGYNGKKVVECVNENTTAEEAYQIAKECKFGCVDCLVIQTPEGDLYKGDPDAFSDDEFCGAVTKSTFYREKFSDPRFNPRWACGLAHCTYIRSESGVEAPEED